MICRVLTHEGTVYAPDFATRDDAPPHRIPFVIMLGPPEVADFSAAVPSEVSCVRYAEVYAQLERVLSVEDGGPLAIYRMPVFAP